MDNDERWVNFRKEVVLIIVIDEQKIKKSCGIILMEDGYCVDNDD